MLRRRIAEEEPLDKLGASSRLILSLPKDRLGDGRVIRIGSKGRFLRKAELKA
jgi:hypothetical protein